MTLHSHTQSNTGDKIPPRSRSGANWLRGVAIVVMLGLVVWLWVAGHPRQWMESFLTRVEGGGVWGPIAFVGIYALAAVLFIPGSVLTLGAGAVFGVVKGCLWVSLASTLGATLAFLVGRYLARDWVAKKIQGNATFAAIDRAVAQEGWKIVGLTRLSPIFPFNLLNYAFGLTQVSFRDYVLASWIGMMPGTVLFVYLGSLARAGTRAGEKTAGEWGLYLVGLLATLAATYLITRSARKVLAQKAAIAPEAGASKDRTNPS